MDEQPQFTLRRPPVQDLEMFLCQQACNWSRTGLLHQLHEVDADTNQTSNKNSNKHNQRYQQQRLLQHQSQERDAADAKLR